MAKAELIVLKGIRAPDMLAFYVESPVRSKLFPLDVEFPNGVKDKITVNVTHVHGVSYFQIKGTTSIEKVLTNCGLMNEPMPLNKLWDLYLATKFDTQAAADGNFAIFPHYLTLYFLPCSADSLPAPYIALPPLPQFLTRTLRHVSQLADIVPQQPGLTDRQLSLLRREICKAGKDIDGYLKSLQTLCWLIQTIRLARPTKLEFSDELSEDGYQITKQLAWLNKSRSNGDNNPIDSLLELAGSPLRLRVFVNEDKIGCYLALTMPETDPDKMTVDFIVTPQIMRRIEGLSIS